MRSDVKFNSLNLSSKRKGKKKRLKKTILFFAHLINHHPWRPITDSASSVSYFSIRSCVRSVRALCLSLSFSPCSRNNRVTTFHRRGSLPATVPTYTKATPCTMSVVTSALNLGLREISFFRSSCSALYSRLQRRCGELEHRRRRATTFWRVGRSVPTPRDTRRTKIVASAYWNLSQLHSCNSDAWS